MYKAYNKDVPEVERPLGSEGVVLQQTVNTHIVRCLILILSDNVKKESSEPAVKENMLFVWQESIKKRRIVEV